MSQQTFVYKEDKFVNSLNLTDDKIKEDLEKMKDIEGFPLGDVEDILELSEPPYYTAYPNPYIKDFIEYFGTPYDEETDDYDVEPFVGDVSEGKNNSIYNAHSYPTKVPYKAIKKFIEHYTQEGDLIFDGFSGTGMSGVAAISSNRNAILSDLSVFGSFIARNYNYSTNLKLMEDAFKEIVNDLHKELNWMYETKHTNGKMGIINSVIWSDVFYCPYCNKEFVFWDLAVDDGKVKKELVCECGSKFSKNKCKRVFIDYFDNKLNKSIKLAKQVPVEIDYTYNRKRYSKSPDEYDFELLKKIDETIIPFWHPIYELKDGYNTKQPINSHGLKYSHLFFSKRNLYFLSFLFKLMEKYSFDKKYLFTSIFPSIGRMYKFRKGGGGQPAGNNLYIPSLNREQNPFNVLNRKFKQLFNAEIELNKVVKGNTLVSTQSSTDLLNIPKNSIDYIFVDPPFGANIMYSELNSIQESWLKVFTNNKDEAIVNSKQNKDLDDYRILLTKSFSMFFNILKPNRWITIEFHNKKAEIWNAIQEAVIQSGFVISQVSILDKQQATFKQVTSPNSVENDLIINAYKPTEIFTENFVSKSGYGMEVEFIKMHLDKLPIAQNIERKKRRLYSKLLTQYLQNGFEVELDGDEFYDLLNNNFIERDGFWFNVNQIEEYETNKKLFKKINTKDIKQSSLGIYDEKDAILWLFNFLETPKEYKEIHTEYLKNLQIAEDQIPDLADILNENFTTENNKYRLPSDSERIINEENRNKKLQKAFDDILDEINSSKNKITKVRKEALSFGLMNLYNEKDVDTIKLLGERIDKKIIESDDDISAIINWAKYK